MTSPVLFSTLRTAVAHPLLWTLLLTAALPDASAQALRGNPGFQARSVARNDDGSSPLEPLGFTINLFGKVRTAGYVNNNGNITFDSALSAFTPFGLQSTSREIIAPFFADVDTRPEASRQVTYGQDTVNGHRAFAANYVDVGYYSNHTDKLNSFQVVLIERADQGPGDFDIEFNYERIAWETGDASGGVNGFGGTPAAVGWSNGTDTSFELPGSLVPGAFLDNGPRSLVRQSITGAVVNTPATTATARSGRLVFRARDGVISPGLVITGGQFADAIEGVPYSATLGVSGAQPPFTWTLQSDITDPPGLSLSKAGILSGTPTAAGTYNFTLGVSGRSEDGDVTVYQRANLTVQPPAVRILTACPLPDAHAGSPYSLLLRGDGVPGLQWSLTDTAALPPGLALNSAGLLAGTPQQPGTFMLHVRATGPTAGTIPAQTLCRLNVHPASVLLTSGCYPRATVGVPFAQSLTSAGGSGPFRYELLGQLPLGLALTEEGLLAGTPATYGVWLFQIATTDGRGARQQSDCNMIVEPARFSTSVCPLPAAITGIPYSAALGSGFTWSAVGTLPAGLTLDPAGRIAGTPMTVGAAQFRLVAANSAGQQSGEACSLIVQRGPLGINGCPLPDARAGEPYSARISGAGGNGSGEFLLSALGLLPPGLVLSGDGLLSGTPSSSGSYPFTAVVRENASSVAGATRFAQACGIQVRPPELRITTACPLPDGYAGQTYATQLQAAGGTPPYRFSFSPLPDGITGAADGSLRGTPLRPGGRAFTVQVADATHSAQSVCSLHIGAPRVPEIRLSDLPATLLPAAANVLIGVQLAAPYTSSVQGVVSLQVRPDTQSTDAVANSADPRLSFANGQLTAAFTIPAGATRINLPLVSTGTVASTVTVALRNLSSSGVPVTQYPAPKLFSIPAGAPQITAACYVRTPTENGLTLHFRISGLSSTRELRRADLVLPGTAGQLRLPPVPAEFLIQGSDRVTIDVAQKARDYFGSHLNIRTGGAFSLEVPLDLAVAPQAALPSLSLTLVNAVGESAARTVAPCN